MCPYPPRPSISPASAAARIAGQARRSRRRRLWLGHRGRAVGVVGHHAHRWAGCVAGLALMRPGRGGGISLRWSRPGGSLPALHGLIAVTERGAGFEFGVFATMSELLDGHPQAELVLVDIPIGLPWSNCPFRPCDAAARARLRAPRSSSAFPAPSRSAAKADSFVSAQRLNHVAQADGVLDALVACVTARVGLKNLKQLRGPGPTHDEEGLPMELLHL